MNIGERPGKRRKRAVACNRCHKHKIKCSGEHPCQSCQQANAAAECEFPNRDRQVTVQESYIQKLEAQVRELKAQVEVERCSSLPSLAEGRNSAVDQVAEANAAADADLPNLLLELRHGKSPNHALPFAGEASCTAFSDRLLHCIDRNQDTVSHSALPDHISGPMFNRLMSSNYQLPDRVRASLLIRRVDRFIGNNYQLFLKKSFFRKFDETYASNNFSDVLWGCHLFALLALGELYSCYHAEPTNGKDVPGTAYFLQAITLLQDDYEHPSIEQIQVLLLLSFYANCIGRLQSAHVYCGIALRSSISLGLHRSRSTTTGLSRKDQEHRRRIWWTLYLFDRLISSKLGFPLGIRDEDIDVEMPSSESLTSEDQQEFHDPKHLCAHVKLSRITGSILTDVYCLPNHGTTTFVRRVHRVLNQLRKWDSELPSELRIQADNSARNLYTLHMHYHLCIIQTTRPILFHIFTTELQSSNATPSHSFSPTTLALADACKQSAMSTNHLLSRLFIDGNLAVFGYFDSHYIFSSTLILIIAGTMEPAAKLSEAVQMAFSLLGTMASNGNVSAKDYLRRLGKIQSSIITSRDASLTANASAMPSRVSPGITSEAATSRVPHAYQNESEHNWPLPSSYFQDDAVQPSDPLGNPFIEDFLAEKAFEWPSGPSPQQDIFRQFTHELGDELIFGF